MVHIRTLYMYVYNFMTNLAAHFSVIVGCKFTYIFTFCVLFSSDKVYTINPCGPIKGQSGRNMHVHVCVTVQCDIFYFFLPPSLPPSLPPLFPLFPFFTNSPLIHPLSSICTQSVMKTHQCACLMVTNTIL